MRRYLQKLNTPFGPFFVLALGTGVAMGAEAIMERGWREGILPALGSVGMMLLSFGALFGTPLLLLVALSLVMSAYEAVVQRFRRPPAPAAPPPRRATTVHARLLTPDVPPVRPPPRPRPAPPADKPRSPGGAVDQAVRCHERGQAYPTQPLARGDNGYVYVFANRSMPGVFKVGQTNRDPLQRARELHTTGVPIPFLCVYSRASSAPKRVEVMAHRSLRASRLSSSREFFVAELWTVVAAVEEAAGLVERTARRAPSAHA